MACSQCNISSGISSSSWFTFSGGKLAVACSQYNTPGGSIVVVFNLSLASVAEACSRYGISGGNHRGVHISGCSRGGFLAVRQLGGNRRRGGSQLWWQPWWLARSTSSPVAASSSCSSSLVAAASSSRSTSLVANVAVVRFLVASQRHACGAALLVATSSSFSSCSLLRWRACGTAFLVANSRWLARGTTSQVAASSSSSTSLVVSVAEACSQCGIPGGNRRGAHISGGNCRGVHISGGNRRGLLTVQPLGGNRSGSSHLSSITTTAATVKLKFSFTSALFTLSDWTVLGEICSSDGSIVVVFNLSLVANVAVARSLVASQWHTRSTASRWQHRLRLLQVPRRGGSRPFLGLARSQYSDNVRHGGVMLLMGSTRGWLAAGNGLLSHTTW